MISKKDCARVVDAFLDAIKDALREQKNIEVRGFGTFKIRHRKTRMARNPRTGSPVEVSARPVPVFKPSKELRAMVAEEHLIADRAMRTRWRGEPLSPDAPISWDLVAAATTERPEFMQTLGPFLGMFALPHSIDPLRDQVRTMLRNGWRPRTPRGPTRNDLVAAISGSPSTMVPQPLVPSASATPLR